MNSSGRFVQLPPHACDDLGPRVEPDLVARVRRSACTDRRPRRRRSSASSKPPTASNASRRTAIAVHGDPVDASESVVKSSSASSVAASCRGCSGGRSRRCRAGRTARATGTRASSAARCRPGCGRAHRPPPPRGARRAHARARRARRPHDRVLVQRANTNGAVVAAMPWFAAAANPRLRVVAQHAHVGNADSMRRSLPSVDALSTTTISAGDSLARLRRALDDARHRRCS